MNAVNKPVLFHDPTSEPSRAVHWLAIEAGLEIELEYTWLTRDEHLDPRFLAINPGHQVPALVHNEFCVAEASAIMLYLVDINEVQGRWVGATPEDRAFTHRLLSWHHTNTCRARRNADTNSSECGQQFEGTWTAFRANVDTLAVSS
jgi:glutathione S-transferase